MVIPLIAPSDGLVGAYFKRPPTEWQDGDSGWEGMGRYFEWEGPIFPPEILTIPEHTFSLEVALDPAFVNIVATKTVQDIYTVKLDIDLLPQTTYYWRVAWNGSYTGDFAAFHTTFAAPDIAVQDDISIEGAAAKLSWDIDNPSINELIISKTVGDPPQPIQASVPVEDSAYIVDNLTVDVAYSLSIQSQGEIEFDYSSVLASAGLDVIVIGDGTEVVTEDDNYVIVKS